MRAGADSPCGGERQTEQITALVPLAETADLCHDAEFAHGRTRKLCMEFSRYDEVPRELAVRIIDTHQGGNTCGDALIDWLVCSGWPGLIWLVSFSHKSQTI